VLARVWDLLFDKRPAFTPAPGHGDD